MMAGRAAARAVTAQRQFGHQKRLLYKKQTQTERTSTTLGLMMGVYTVLVIIYLVLDYLGILDAKEFERTYLSNKDSMKNYDPKVHDRIEFMITLRIVLLVPIVLTMILTWINQVFLEIYLITLPISTFSLIMAAIEFSFFLDLKEVVFVNEKEPEPLEI